MRIARGRRFDMPATKRKRTYGARRGYWRGGSRCGGRILGYLGTKNDGSSSRGRRSSYKNHSRNGAPSHPPPTPPKPCTHTPSSSRTTTPGAPAFGQNARNGGEMICVRRWLSSGRTRVELWQSGCSRNGGGSIERDVRRKPTSVPWPLKPL